MWANLRQKGSFLLDLKGTSRSKVHLTRWHFWYFDLNHHILDPWTPVKHCYNVTVLYFIVQPDREGWPSHIQIKHTHHTRSKQLYIGMRNFEMVKIWFFQQKWRKRPQNELHLITWAAFQHTGNSHSHIWVVWNERYEDELSISAIISEILHLNFLHGAFKAGYPFLRSFWLVFRDPPLTHFPKYGYIFEKSDQTFVKAAVLKIKWLNCYKKCKMTKNNHGQIFPFWVLRCHTCNSTLPGRTVFFNILKRRHTKPNGMYRIYEWVYNNDVRQSVKLRASTSRIWHFCKKFARI